MKLAAVTGQCHRSCRLRLHPDPNRHRQTHLGRRHAGTDTNIELATIKAVLSAVNRVVCFHHLMHCLQVSAVSGLRESSKASKTKGGGGCHGDVPTPLLSWPFHGERFLLWFIKDSSILFPA